MNLMSEVMVKIHLSVVFNQPVVLEYQSTGIFLYVNHVLPYRKQWQKVEYIIT